MLIYGLRWRPSWIFDRHKKNINFVEDLPMTIPGRVPTLFCPRNSRSFQGVFKGFLHFFKVSLNIPNELRDSQNQSLNINWTGIAYYILSTLHVMYVLLDPCGSLQYIFLFLHWSCLLSISRLLFFCALTFQWMS